MDHLIATAESSVRKAKFTSDLAKTWAARNLAAKRLIAVTKNKLEKNPRLDRVRWEGVLASHEKREKESAQKAAETSEKVGPAWEEAEEVVNYVALEISRMPSEKIVEILKQLIWKL